MKTPTGDGKKFVPNSVDSADFVSNSAGSYFEVLVIFFPNYHGNWFLSLITTVTVFGLYSNNQLLL
jgi:hypothetical protein